MSEINYNLFKCYDSKVSPTLYNRLVDAVQSNGLEPGIGYLLTRSTLGTTLRIKAGANGSFTPPEPFAVTTVPISGDDSSVTVKVTPGTMNSLVPDNMFDSLTATIDDVNYVTLDVTTDGQNITNYEIDCSTDAPDGQNAVANALPTTFDICLAVIQSGKAYQAQYGSFTVYGTNTFTVNATEPVEPGLPVTTPYYQWTWVQS
jgi:hypothetical protein